MLSGHSFKNFEIIYLKIVVSFGTVWGAPLHIVNYNSYFDGKVVYQDNGELFTDLFLQCISK